MLRLVWPSILLQSARGRVATAAKSVAASQLWSAMSVNNINNTIKRFKILIGSLGHHQNVTHCWQNSTRHTCKVSLSAIHHAPSNMATCPLKHRLAHTLTHSLTHKYTTNGWCPTSWPYQYNVSIICTSWVPVEGKSSVCLICMKYRIIILLIIIISLGEIIIVYCKHIMQARTLERAHASTHARARMHTRAHRRARTRVHTHTPPSPSRFDGWVAPKRDGVNAPFCLFLWHYWPVAWSFK